MIILRFKIRSKPDKSDELMSALAEIITPARATSGVINFDASLETDAGLNPTRDHGVPRRVPGERSRRNAGA